MDEHQVIITDVRKDWMKKEDGEYACRRCSLYKNCSSRYGLDCKRLGGSEIPKIRYQKRKGRRVKK